MWIFDEEGRGLEGKSVHLWVKPDSPDYMDESVLFQPGNPRVGVRAAALQELGGGAYLFDDRAGEGGEGGEGGSPFLWATLAETLPGEEDGRYGDEGAWCGNCSNAPFAYTFVADGVRLPTVQCVCVRERVGVGREYLRVTRYVYARMRVDHAAEGMAEAVCIDMCSFVTDRSYARGHLSEYTRRPLVDSCTCW